MNRNSNEKYAVDRLKDKTVIQKLKNFNGIEVRDDEGYQRTVNSILTSVKNDIYSASEGFPLLGRNSAYSNGFSAVLGGAYSNFSESDVAGITDMRVVDLTIATFIKSSALNFLAVDIPMDNITINAAFQCLVAANSVNGINRGDTLVDPRAAMNPLVNLGISSAQVTFSDVISTSGTSVSNNKPIVPNRTELYKDYGTSNQVLVGYAVRRESMDPKDTFDDIVFKTIPTGVTNVANARINHINGELTGFDATAGSITVVAYIDRSGESDGANTLRLKPKTINVSLTASRNRLHLENNLEDHIQMNKILMQNSEAGIPVDYSKRAFSQLALINQYFYDNQIVSTLYEAVKDMQVSKSIDLTGYPTNSFQAYAPTKNDYIRKFMIDLAQIFLNRTGRGVTAWVVDSVSSSILSTTPEFRPVDGFLMVKDGMIGTYNNTPVLKYSYLDAKKVGGSNIGEVIGVFKDVSGNAAPIAWGNYINPFSTLPSLNPNNPSQVTSALYSMTAVKLISDSWIIRGQIQSY